MSAAGARPLGAAGGFTAAAFPGAFLWLPSALQNLAGTLTFLDPPEANGSPPLGSGGCSQKQAKAFGEGVA